MSPPRLAADLAADLATAVAARDPRRLAERLTGTVRLRALLPGGLVEAHGADDVAGCFAAFFADFETVEVRETAGQAVGDRFLLHYRLRVGRAPTHWACTQTTVTRVVDGRLAVIDLLCSGFRRIDDDDDHRTPPCPGLLG